MTTPKKIEHPFAGGGTIEEAGIIAGLIRKSSVEYPPECVSAEDRTAYEQGLIQTRMGELVSDAARDGVVITRWYIDLDVSGRAAYEHKREGLQQLLSDARAGLVRILYAREVSRIYRDTVKSIVFKGEMKKAGVDVRARDLIRSDDSATETLVQTIQFAVDQFQSERTGIQIRSRNFQAFLAGQWPGLARSLWGLSYNEQEKRFDFDPATAPYVRRVMDLLVEERGNAYRTALRLNTWLQDGSSEAIPTPGGNLVPWKAKDVLRIAENPIYRRCGTYAKEVRPMPELIPEVVPEATLAEVDYALRLRRETLGGRRKRGGREDYTYGPLMRCGDCGTRMRTIRFLVLRDEGNPSWLYWTCRMGSDSRVVCPNSWSFSQVRLDRLVGRGLSQALTEVVQEISGAEPSAGAPVNKLGKGSPAKNNTGKNSMMDKNSMEATLVKLDAQIERTMHLYTGGVTADFDWVQGEVKKLQDQKRRLAEQDKVDPPPVSPLAQLSPVQWEHLSRGITDYWQIGPTVPLEAKKLDLLLALGVSLTVYTVPRTTPPARRGIDERGRPRKDGAKTGGRLRILMEIAAFGRVGDSALVCEETEEEWYENHCANLKAAAQKREAKKQEYPGRIS